MGTTSCGQIYLYGELHCEEKIMERQLELWYNHYHKENLRHLFLEHCYCTTKFLNIWMRSESDNVLEMLYEIALAQTFLTLKIFSER